MGDVADDAGVPELGEEGALALEPLPLDDGGSPSAMPFTRPDSHDQHIRHQSTH